MAIGLMRSIVWSVALYLVVSSSEVARSETAKVWVCNSVPDVEVVAYAYMQRHMQAYIDGQHEEYAELYATQDEDRSIIDRHCEYPDPETIEFDSQVEDGCILLLERWCLEVDYVSYKSLDGEIYGGYSLTDGMHMKLRGGIYEVDEFRTALFWRMFWERVWELVTDLIHSLTHYSSCETVTVEETTFTIDDGTCADRSIFGWAVFSYGGRTSVSI